VTRGPGYYVLYALAAGGGVALALSPLDRCAVAYGMLALFLVPLTITAFFGPWSSEGREPGIWFAFAGLGLAALAVSIFGC
jgi:hypothetical protein